MQHSSLDEVEVELSKFGNSTSPSSTSSSILEDSVEFGESEYDEEADPGP